MQQPVKKDKINRKLNYPIHDVLSQRWSARAMSGEAMSDEELMPLFEAARWAPSAFNNQPWRFVYAKRETQGWNTIFNLMVDFNKSWTRQAAALVVVISRKNYLHNDKFAKTHSYDAGAAAMSIAIEGTSRGFVVHTMEGFDYDGAHTMLNIPDDYQVEALIAIGKPAPKETLPQELQQRELVSDRRPLSEFLFLDTFKQ